MATGSGPQGLVVDQLKFVQMGRGHFFEPDGGSIVKDEAHNGFVCRHQCLGQEAAARPGWGFHNVEGCKLRLTRCNREHEGRKWSGSILYDNLDFMDFVQRIHLNTYSHLCVDPELVGVQCEQGHAGFLLKVSPSPQGCGLSVGPCLSYHDAGSKEPATLIIGIGRRVGTGNETIRNKVVKESWREDGSL